MKKKVSVSIPESCSEDWDAMPISNNGRSCGKCQLVVRDYSKLSDTELLYALKTDRNTCGNFRKNQLDRNLHARDLRLFPTMNLHAIALGLGVLIATPGYAAQSSVQLENIHLIEIAQGTTTLPEIDQTPANDSTVTFRLQIGPNHTPLNNAEIEFIDDRGNVADLGRTNDQGVLVYEKKMLHELRITEIRFIPKDKNVQPKTIEWESTDVEEKTIVFNDEHQPPRHEKGVRGVYIGL